MNVKIIVNEGKWSYDEIVAAGKTSEVFRKKEGFE